MADMAHPRAYLTHPRLLSVDSKWEDMLPAKDFQDADERDDYCRPLMDGLESMNAGLYVFLQNPDWSAWEKTGAQDLYGELLTDGTFNWTTMPSFSRCALVIHVYVSPGFVCWIEGIAVQETQDDLHWANTERLLDMHSVCFALFKELLSVFPTVAVFERNPRIDWDSMGGFTVANTDCSVWFKKNNEETSARLRMELKEEVNSYAADCPVPGMAANDESAEDRGERTRVFPFVDAFLKGDASSPIAKERPFYAQMLQQE